MALNRYGLVSAVRNLIQANKASHELRAKLLNAESAWKKNCEHLQELKRELGAHTQAVGHPEIVIVEGLAAYIPVPQIGYSDPSVEVQFSTPVTPPAE